MFKKNFKKVMGILLTLAVVISGLPIGSMVAYADEVEKCTCEKKTITEYTAHKAPGGNLGYGITYYGYNDYICTKNKVTEPVDGKVYTSIPAGQAYLTRNEPGKGLYPETDFMLKNYYSNYYKSNRAGNFVNWPSRDFILYYSEDTTLINHLDKVSFKGGTYSYWSDGLYAGGSNRYYLDMNLYYFTSETKTVGNDPNPGAWTYNSTTGKDEQICQECGKVCDTRDHQHDYSDHSGPTSNATCTEKGHDIWTCPCGAKTDKSTQNALGHDWKETSRTPATCTEDGVVNYVCVRDNGNGTCSATKSETLDKTGHSATHHDAVTLTTTTVGHPEYWTCSNSCCEGKKFKDAECTTELTDAEYNIQLPTSVKNFVDYANNNVLDPYKIGKNVEVEVTQALSAWNKLSDAEKAILGVSTIKDSLVSIDNEYQTAASAKRAKDAQDAIDAIGTVHYTTESNNLIKEAEYAIYILNSYGEYTSFAAANEDRIKTLTDARDLYDGMNGLSNFNTQIYQVGNNIYNANLMDGSKNSSANIQNMINTLEENEDLFDNKYFAYRYNDTKTTYKSPLDTIDTDLPAAITRLKGELTKAQAREKDEADLATYKKEQKKALNEFVVPILAETNDAYDHEIELLLDTALSNIGSASDKDTVDNVVDAAKNDINKKLAEYRDNTSDKTKNKAEVKKYAEDELNNSLTDDLNDEELETLTKEIADLVKNYDGSDKDKDTVKKAIDDKIDAAEQKSAQNKADKEAKEKAQHLIDLINALPNPDTASDDDIINAADDIDNVTLSTSKDFYDNILNDINNENTHLVSDELLQKMSKDAARLLTLRNEVSNVEKAINALNNPVTLDDEDAIKNAREAYDELSDAQKNLVNSDVLKKLENAEKKLSNLKNEENEKTQAEKLKAELEKAQAEAEKAKAEAEKAQAELEKVKAEQEKAEAESKAQVESVIKLINSVEITKESIEKVRAAYEALDATQKAQIDAETLKKLTDAETAYAQSIENNPQSTIQMNSGFKVSQTGKKVNVTWSEVEDADYYVVYANYCGKNTSVKYKTTTTNTSYSFTTMNGKKLDLTKNYKVQVKAYAIVNGEEVCVSKTVIGHIVGSKNTKYTNAKSIKVGSSNVTLNVGGISKIKATTVKVDSSKKILSDAHAKEFRYRSRDKSVCTVKSDGTIVAKSAGTTYVYVYAKNGYCKTIKVTVNGLTEGAARYRF